MRGQLLGLISVLTSSNSLAFAFRKFHKVLFSSALLFTASTPRMSAAGAVSSEAPFDPVYPGTAVVRLNSVISRVQSLTTADLSVEWEEVRRKILWAGGLKDLPNSRPGQGYTGHSFNDYNHCDLTTMLGHVASNENRGKVAGIQYSNQLGPGIQLASIPELGDGGSWSTCMMGCNKEPPQDVAHVQFQSRIAFKLVWCPPTFTSFVMVDDAGSLLNWGTPTGTLPHISERQQNFRLVEGSKYEVAARSTGEAVAAGVVADAPEDKCPAGEKCV